MMMNELFLGIIALIAGGFLGIFFFGGLWWTIQKALSSKTPALWFLSSMIIRLGGTLTGFYFISGGRWERIVICLLGFVIARFFIIRLKQQSGTVLIDTKTSES